MATQESREGKTPNGGTQSVAYYLDDKGRPAEKKVATNIEVIELDAKGNEVHRTYGRIK